MLLRIHSAGLSKHRTRYWSISICRLSQQTSCDADLQYHIVMDNYFTSPALLRHLSAIGVAATRTVRANRMENAPLRDIVKINKESVDHQMSLLMSPWTSLQYVAKIIKSRMQFPPLLVNNQLNRSNVIFVVKSGEWILNNHTLGELIAWIKIYQRIWLTYAQRNSSGQFFDLLLMWLSIMFTKYIANPT